VLDRTPERLRRQVAEHPADSANWWTALPSDHFHVFAFEKGQVLDDFVVENDPIDIKHGVLKTALMQTLGVRDAGDDPFNARMKTFLQLGLFGPIGIQRERRNYGYSLASALRWAVAMTLQRAYVRPARWSSSSTGTIGTSRRCSINSAPATDRRYASGSISRRYSRSATSSVQRAAGRVAERPARSTSMASCTRLSTSPPRRPSSRSTCANSATS